MSTRTTATPKPFRDNEHACPGGCGEVVPNHLFACRDCWNRLPKRLQDGITKHYRHNSVAHVHAMADAMDFYLAVRAEQEVNSDEQPQTQAQADQ